MEIKKAEFVTSAVKPSQYPVDNMPYISFVGKSNVGKSSLINTLCNNYKLARVSGEPGKTRLINFFRINDESYLVDLPGYGFARVSKTEQQSWQRMMEDFFSNANNLVGIVLIVDIRHDPTAEDKQMAEWIRYYQVPVIIAASKADKLGKTRLKPQCNEIRKLLGFDNDVIIVPYSATTRYGLANLQNALDSFMSSA